MNGNHQGEPHPAPVQCGVAAADGLPWLDKAESRKRREGSCSHRSHVPSDPTRAAGLPLDTAAPRPVLSRVAGGGTVRMQHFVTTPVAPVAETCDDALKPRWPASKHRSAASAGGNAANVAAAQRDFQALSRAPSLGCLGRSWSSAYQVRLALHTHSWEGVHGGAQ